jgi:hypothetical protein
LQEGASLIVKHGVDELGGYPFVGSPVWANLLKPARGTDQLSARQRSNTCGGASGFSPAVGVNPALKLPTPVIIGPICPNALILKVRNLRPGAEVTVYAEKVMLNGSAAGALVGQARAWATDCDFALPPAWADHPQLTSHPGTLIIKVWQSNCDKGSDHTTHPVEPLPGAVGQPGMDKPVECARLISAKSLTPGAVVVVSSDQADSPLLSGPVFVTASNMSISLYRPLRQHEHVQLKQTGCNVAANSLSTQVDPFSGVPAPFIVVPVRIPHGGATLRKLVIGARVHVFVNTLLKTSFDAVATEMFVPLPDLTREAVVVARQAMCTKISDESNREVAKLGEMKASYSPSPIIRGKPASITVTAKDRDTGQPVNGNVKIGGSIVGATGAAFGFTFPSGPAAVSSVEAANYVSAPISWDLVDPPPQPPAKLHLSINNQATSFFKITAVTWSVERQELNGTYTLIASPSGESVIVQPPTNGQYHVHAAVSVDDLVNGGNILATFRGNATIHGLHTLLVVWTNADLSQNFRLFSEPQVNWAGGTAYTVYNPVVAL